MDFQVTPLTGSIGGLVEGIDLKQPLSPALFEKVHSAFLRYQVLVFRGQNMFEPEQLLRFSKLWGTPVPASKLGPYLKDHPEITHVTKIPKAMASTEAWHYDSPYTPIPPKISILSAVTVPHGGDTMWCNQYHSYERLSPVMQRMLQGLRVQFQAIRLARFQGVPASEAPSATHPLVRTHPETGRKVLYLGPRDNVRGIEGLSEAEGRPLLDFLYEHSTQPDNVYRHMWRANDVVMWDNRCTMHYAVHDYGTQERVLNRVTLKGDVPV